MKVVFVSSYPPSHCGIGEYTRMLTASLRSLTRRLEIHVLSDRVGSDGPWIDDYSGVYVHPLFSRGSDRDLGKLLDVLTQLNGADILHVQHDYSLYGYGDKVLRVLREAKEEGLIAKTVVTMHTVHHPYSDEELAVDFQRKLNSVDKVIVHSHLQEFELRNQGVEPRKVERIPHGTLLNPYLGYPKVKLMESLNLRDEQVNGAIVVVPGFLKKDKGLDVLLKALTEMRLARKRQTVVIAGEVWDREALQYVERMRDVTNIVFWERYLSNDEILKLTALADIILLPYRSVKFYSVSGMLHLSMGSLKPIIGTRVPKLIELYQHAPRLTIPPGDPRALARMMRWVINNYDIVVPYMSFLYSYAVRTQWYRMARRHLNLYIRILKSQRTSGDSPAGRNAPNSFPP